MILCGFAAKVARRTEWNARTFFSSPGVYAWVKVEAEFGEPCLQGFFESLLKEAHEFASDTNPRRERLG